MSASEIFFMSVDGVHFRFYDSRDPAFYSHKFNQAALAYEIGIATRTSDVIWLNGPFPAGQHDITIFRKKLKEMIPKGKKVIGDNGYRGEKKIIATPNSHDPPALGKFKSRARSRHETFNGKIKAYMILDNRFRHGEEKHKTVFEAMCVIVQYQMELGSPLFDL